MFGSTYATIPWIEGRFEGGAGGFPGGGGGRGGLWGEGEGCWSFFLGGGVKEPPKGGG